MERDPIGNKHADRSGARLTLPFAPRVLLALLAALLVAVVSAAAVQASESSESPVAAATHAAIRAARKAERQAQKLLDQEARRARRQARAEARREAHQQAHAPQRLALKEKEGNTVTITCTGVTIAFNGFPVVPGSPNVISEWIAIKNPPESLGSGPIAFPQIAYHFAGPNAVQLVPIAFPVGHYLVDVHAKWSTNGVHGDFDIHGNVTCTPTPNFTVRKLEAIAGSGRAASEGPLSGLVGQVVDYTIVATNTGNTPLTFAAPNDPHCDPGTISPAGSVGPVEPLGTATFTCTHKLTEADREAGSYSNVATVTGTPEEGEGPPKSKESNTVVVTPITTPAESPKEETKKEEPKKEEQPKPEEHPKKEETKPSEERSPTGPGSGTTTPVGGVLGTSSITGSKSGVLGFTSAVIPSLAGPQGCVRGSFVASIKAAGVSTVVFYLDGHKLRTLTAKNARKGLLSVRVDASKLRVGVHHLLARITMKKASASAKAAKAARSLTIVRCGSSFVTPHFTG